MNNFVLLNNFKNTQIGMDFSSPVNLLILDFGTAPWKTWMKVKVTVVVVVDFC